jgi:hypothetical protein
MKRTLTYVGGSFLLLILLAPTVKNLILWSTYHHGRTSLEKTDGSPGVLAGTWEGTVDSHPCGYDVRSTYRLTIQDDSTGTYRFQHWTERADGSAPNVYSWQALRPYGPTPDQTERRLLQVEDGTLVMELKPSEKPHQQPLMAYELDGDRLNVSYVGRIGDRPSEWGFAMSIDPPTLWQLVDIWGYHPL